MYLQNPKVVCVNDKPLEGNHIAPAVKVGDEHDIKSVFTCKCGQQHYDVGLPLNINYVECYKCRETLPPTTHWCNSIRFEIAPFKQGIVTTN